MRNAVDRFSHLGRVFPFWESHCCSHDAFSSASCHYTPLTAVVINLMENMVYFILTPFNEYELCVEKQIASTKQK